MFDRNIILTGFMGTGKSTVGRLLAVALGFDFVDTDDLIVTRDGRSIAKIFSEDGPAAFRTWERKISHELATTQNMVISTGGRLMLDEVNGELLSKTGFAFCLSALPETIIKRLATDGTRRPLLEVPNPVDRIMDLLERRAEQYGRFPQIRTDNKSPQEICDEIMSRLSEQPATELEVSHPNGRYTVSVGYDLLPRLRELAGIGGTIVLITDSNVGPLHAASCGDVACTITVPAGEANKNLDTIRHIYDKMFAASIDRQGTIVALGGGVVGDMAGFVAATYMRGIDFVQCPTTVLSMVDASVGGKTGVDMPQGKNLVGAFKQPTAVIADLSTLQTLPAAEFSAGLAEVVKHGLIADSSLLERLEGLEIGDLGLPQSQTSNLQSLISDAIKVKQEIVQADPYEKGRRAVLNLGHTFAHAIEKVSQFEVGHGTAVGMGLVAAAHLSAQLEHCDPALQTRIEKVLVRLNLPSRIPAYLDSNQLLKAMSSDKKKAKGQLRFILIRDVADVFVTSEVSQQTILQTLDTVRN